MTENVSLKIKSRCFLVSYRTETPVPWVRNSNLRFSGKVIHSFQPVLLPEPESLSLFIDKLGGLGVNSQIAARDQIAANAAVCTVNHRVAL